MRLVDESLIEEAGNRLASAAPGARVILFGSHARGEADGGSDVDFLVVQPAVKDRFAESARLMGLIGRMGVPADVVVVTEDHARRRGAVEGTMIHEALTEGRVLASTGR